MSTFKAIVFEDHKNDAGLRIRVVINKKQYFSCGKRIAQTIEMHFNRKHLLKDIPEVICKICS